MPASELRVRPWKICALQRLHDEVDDVALVPTSRCAFRDFRILGRYLRLWIETCLIFTYNLLLRLQINVPTLLFYPLLSI